MHVYTLVPGDTPRQQLANVESNPTCIGCHQIFDPDGFTLDGFDDSGRPTSFDTSASVIIPDANVTVVVTGIVDLATALGKSVSANRCVIDRYIEHAVDRPFQLQNGTLPAPPPPRDGAPAPLPRPPDEPDIEWDNCLQQATGDLQTLQETLVTSQAFATVRLPDSVHYGTPASSNSDPIAHAEDEAQQLIALLSGDPSALNDYEAALREAWSFQNPVSGEAGAGGADSAGAGGVDAGGAGGAP
jgi:hypothetical protein